MTPRKKSGHKSDTTIDTTTVVSDTTYAPTEVTEDTTVAASGYTFTETEASSKAFTSKKSKPPSQPFGEQLKLGFLVANGNYELADDYDAVRAAAVRSKDKTRIAQADAGWKLKEANDREKITTHWPPKIACCGMFWTLGHYPMWGDKVTKLKHHESHITSHSKSHHQISAPENGNEGGEESEVIEETEIMGADGKITKVKKYKKIHSEKLEWGEKERAPRPWAQEPKGSIADDHDGDEKKKKVFHEKLEWKVKDRVPLFTPAPRASKSEGKKKKGKHGGKGGGSEESIATTIAGDDESVQGDEPDEYDESGKLIPKPPRKKIFHEKLKWEVKERAPLFTPTTPHHKPKHAELEAKKKRKKSKVGVAESELSIVDKHKKPKDKKESVVEPEDHHKKHKKDRRKTKHAGGSHPSIQESALTIATIEGEVPEVHGEDKEKHKKPKKSKAHPEMDASVSSFQNQSKAKKSRGKSMKHDGGEPKEIRGRSHDPIDLDRESMLGSLDDNASLAGKGKSGKHKGKKSIKPKATGEETPIPKARNLSSHRLRVSNLPVGVTVAELEPIFPGGTITLEHIGTTGKPKTVADVKFEEETDTFTAFKNSKTAELHGKPLIVAPLVRDS